MIKIIYIINVKAILKTIIKKVKKTFDKMIKINNMFLA